MIWARAANETVEQFLEHLGRRASLSFTADVAEELRERRSKFIGEIQEIYNAL
jgi:hypothetical protein